MRRVVGVDVGGTFTDLLLYEAGPQGTHVRLAKILTTAANQADGVLAAIANAGASPRDLDLVIHGTTTTTNAVLERKVARSGSSPRRASATPSSWAGARGRGPTA